jgi:predicted DCC family thiol-disulfide oxidoreductase YuxK
MSSERVIVFDGVCMLCNDWVRFVLRYDRQRAFKLAAMQTPTGRALLEQHGVDPDDPATFLVIDDGVAYTDTDALIRALGRFGFLWRVCGGALRVVPRAWCNTAYRYIARNRYRYFGRREVCLVPRPEHADRFLP